MTASDLDVGDSVLMLGQRLTPVQLTKETAKAGPDSPFEYTVKKAWRFWIDGTKAEYVTFTFTDIEDNAQIIQKANRYAS